MGIDFYGVQEEMPFKGVQVIGKLQFITIQYPLLIVVPVKELNFPLRVVQYLGKFWCSIVGLIVMV